MKKKNAKNNQAARQTIALVLAALLTLPMSSFAFDPVFAEEIPAETQDVVQDNNGDVEDTDSEPVNDPDNTRIMSIESVDDTVIDSPKDEETAEPVDPPEEPDEPEFPAPEKRKFKSFNSNPVRAVTSGGCKFNLRQYASEGIYGYAIVQGSCTDGTYSYHCLIKTSTNWGKIVKVRMSDGACVAVSNPYFFNHGNGMCYDSKRDRIVVSSYSNGRKAITIVDPNNLNDISQATLSIGDIGAKLAEKGAGNNAGATAISYNAKYDCYLTMQKTSHNIIIYDAETLNAVAAAITDFEGTEGTFQSIDADDTYVYFPLSDVGGRGRNKIICFDWCAEKLAALLNGDSTEDVWYCGGSSTGGRSATINVAGADEIESLYHIESGNGKSRFYLVNYDNDPTYKTYKVKVKWKKVKKKKKVKVKWKKVKKKVKTKKGKIKIKKVWKYKTKIKKKKVWKYKYVDRKKFSHYNRDSFVMDMGVF